MFLISRKAECSREVGCGDETISRLSSSLVPWEGASNHQVPNFSRGEGLLGEALAEGEESSEEEGFLLLLPKRSGLSVRDGAATVLGREAEESELC